MQINLSSETLDHLRYHLDALAKHYAKAAAAARTSGPRERARGHLAEVHDLLGIFNEDDAPVKLTKPQVDFTVVGEGSVFRFVVENTTALEFVNANLGLEAWQWLGDRTFAVDHRVAPQLVAQLRDADFAVVVR